MAHLLGIDPLSCCAQQIGMHRSGVEEEKKSGIDIGIHEYDRESSVIGGICDRYLLAGKRSIERFVYFGGAILTIEPMNHRLVGISGHADGLGARKIRNQTIYAAVPKAELLADFLRLQVEAKQRGVLFVVAHAGE